MEELHLPDNIKVHFAGSEVQNQFVAVHSLGVRYALYTAYPFVERMVFDSPKAPIMPLKWQKDDPFRKIPRHIMDSELHVIQDSGLFTLMFGSQTGGVKDERLMNRWYDALVEFTLANAEGVTCVEVDCQKLLGAEKAWEYRQRMKKDLPNNRIINVFHLEDGMKGLDRLIEYSDYIAISVPELRHAGKKQHVCNIARYIKRRKPDIDIHLLGCTELGIINECRFCTSCDSTSYIAGKRFGFLKGRHINSIRTDAVRRLVGEEIYSKVLEYNNEKNTNFMCLSVELCKRDYSKHAGNQDYIKTT